MKRRDFTLIELMVTVAIIVLLVALLLPAIGNARELAVSSKCQSKLRSIGTAFSSYAAHNNGLMPQTEVSRIAGWNAPGNPVTDPSIIAGLLLSWPECLYIDGDVATGHGNRYGGRSNNDSWHYPIQWEPFFWCPNHNPQYQWGSNSILDRGYGMAWMDTSNFPDSIYVRWSQLNPAHIVATEGTNLMGRHGANAYPPNNSMYGLFERHRQANRMGANYLMGDGHVEFSTQFGSINSPGPGGTPNANQLTYPGNIWVHP